MPGMHAMSTEMVRWHLNVVSVKYAALIAIGVATGCRISEALALRRFDLLTPDGELREQIGFIKLKSRRRDGRVPRRYLAIPVKLRSYILNHLADEERHGHARPDEYVFRGHSGRHLSRKSVYRFFRVTFGRGYGTHWMRKTFAQELYRQFRAEGKPDLTALECVRRALGHSRIDTTIKYLELDDMEIKNAQEAIFANF